MARDNVVMPAVRIPRKLWKSLEDVMRRRMLSGKAELIRDALREYVMRHQEPAAELRISDATQALHQGREEDRRREEELIEWVRKIRA